MKNIILTILLLIYGLSLISQPLTTSENEKAHRRYWFYRSRFINDFTKIGDQQGDCIVLAERNHLGWPVNDIKKSKIGPDQIDIMNQYLSALALEYKLLDRSNQSKIETIKEIFYILKMYNRLDSEADPFWSQNPPTNDHIGPYGGSNLNGFMLREDMPRDYFDSSNSLGNYKHFNYALKEFNNTATDINLSYSGLHKTTKLSNDNKFNNYSGFGSGTSYQEPKNDLPWVHDKYYSMFIAFMLLTKYIPDNTSYVNELGVTQYFQDGASDIKTEVRNIANRCHPYIRGNTFGGPGSNWILEYPNGNNLAIGKDVWPYCYPTAKMLCYINNNYPWNFPPCLGYQDGFSLTAGFSVYNQLCINPIPAVTPVIGSEDAAVFLGNCQAGGNLPFINLPPVTSAFPPLTIIPTSIIMASNSSLNNVEWADLLRRVLHQSGILMKQKSVYANPINEAPCKGPFNFGPNINDNAGFEWRSQDRLEHPKHRLANNPPPLANYPGVDYMLLHNLYYEYINQEDDDNNNENAKYKNAYNLMDNYDEQIWPQKFTTGPNPNSGFTWGVNQIDAQHAPMNVKVFQNLKSNAVIYATTSPLAPNNNIPSKIEYRAGKEIDLLPEDAIHAGFEVKAGSDFNAYILRYVCGQSNYENGMRQNSNNQNSFSSDYESDSMNTFVPIHYVKGEPSASNIYPGTIEEDYSNLNAEDFQKQLLEQYNYANSVQDYNAIMAIENEATAQRFMILPNPNNGIFKIYATKKSTDEIFTITIYNMNSQLIESYKDINENVNLEINLNEKSKGIYLVKIFSNLGYQNSKKVSIQ